ncbi:hypothetical protein GQ42DRAFT_161292 [Ramicandelaber brevisporus]|nr:hypothetical protein GQ42DRAFT_161292 [Ramicandelaber brevisporus]
MARIRDVTPMIEHSQSQTPTASTTTTSTGESLRRMGVFEYYGGRTKQFFSRKFEDLTSSEYSPLQRIPDDEYRDMMSKKLITIEVQLDELDQRIAHVENERQKLLQVMNKQE